MKKAPLERGFFWLRDNVKKGFCSLLKTHGGTVPGHGWLKKLIIHPDEIQKYYLVQVVFMRNQAYSNI